MYNAVRKGRPLVEFSAVFLLISAVGGCDPVAPETGCADPVVSSGSLAIGPSDAVIGLCAGKVLVGNQVQNRVELIDVTSKQVAKTWQLTASPGDIVYDSSTDTAYVTLIHANAIAKIKLNATDVEAIALEMPAVHLALGNDGILFAALEGPWPVRRAIAILSGPEETVMSTLFDDYGTVIAYDRPGNQLLVGNTDTKPTALLRYAFDPTALSLTYVQERWDIGDGEDLVVSPDGDHVAFPSYGGNFSGYTIFDLSTTDLSVSHGEWVTGAYPAAAAFTADGKRLVASNDKEIQVFDATTHVLLHSEKPDASSISCAYPDIRHVAASAAGGIYFAVADCGLYRDTGMLSWFAP